MTFLRTRARRTYEQRRQEFQIAANLFHHDTPAGCDEKRTKVAVGQYKKGRFKMVEVHYKKGPKELGLDFLESPAVRIV